MNITENIIKVKITTNNQPNITIKPKEKVSVVVSSTQIKIAIFPTVSTTPLPPIIDGGVL